MEVQLFGTQKNQDVRKALRFFSERRIKVHFVDLKERPASRGELRRFAQAFGVTALIDTQSKRYAELGLRAVRYDDARWLRTMEEEPLILCQPLVRWQHKLTLGPSEDQWKAWIDSDRIGRSQ